MRDSYFDGLNYAEIQETLSKPAPEKFQLLKLAVLRNITIEPIEPFLAYLSRKTGFRAEIKFGGFDTIVQDAIENPNKLIDLDTDCILVFMTLEGISPNLTHRFLSITKEEIEEEILRISNTVKATLSGIRSHTGALVLWHNMETPAQLSNGAIDYGLSNSQSDVISRINSLIRNIIDENSGAVFIDLEHCFARIGFDNTYDRRMWHLGRAPYSRTAMREIALEAFKLIRALKGQNKKCLVVDCDNTLWGGVVGEDGLDGIKLDPIAIGSAFQEFQQELLNLKQRGVLLALCSKNNEADVWEVFDRHPEMILSRDDIVTARINWNNKADNIVSIANELNIGLDSIVFIDDSVFETELVRQELPEITTIQLPNANPSDYGPILAASGLFDVLAITREDHTRTELYRSEAKRGLISESITDITTYLKTLEMVVEVRFADSFSLPRVAQLTQKTNQFNLTTHRYSEAQIAALSNQENVDVLFLKIKDRFGSLGIVGVCILTYDGYDAEVNTFLLSCRILGRSVEDIFIAESIRLARKRNRRRILGRFRATNKNDQVANFFPGCGFSVIEEHKTEKLFALNLHEYRPPEHNGIAEIISDISMLPDQEMA